MKSLFFSIIAALGMCCSSPAAGRLTQDKLSKVEVGGFRLGMPIAEAEAVIRAMSDIEEPLSNLMQGYDCNDLLPQGSDLAYETLTPRKVAVSYYIDTRDHHFLDVGFEYSPTGTRVARIMYWHFLPDSDWAGYLAFSIKKFGRPDFIRTEKEHNTAIWCEKGDKKCTDDYGYRHRIVLRWEQPADEHGATKPYGRLSVERGLWLEDEYTKAFGEQAKRDPVSGRKLFDQCREFVGTFTERAGFERHLGDMVGPLRTWSPAMSEPRLIDDKLFQPMGLDAKSVMMAHDCAMRRQSGLRDFDCDDRSVFRWMRNKENLWLFAMRDLAPPGRSPPSGTISSESRVYCLVTHEPFGPYELVWAGESLVDLARWLASGEQRKRRKPVPCKLGL